MDLQTIPLNDGYPKYIKIRLEGLLTGRKDNANLFGDRFRSISDAEYDDIVKFVQLYGDILRGVGYIVKTVARGIDRGLQIYFTETVLDCHVEYDPQCSIRDIKGKPYQLSADLVKAINASPAVWREKFQRHYTYPYRFPIVIYGLARVLTTTSFSEGFMIGRVLNYRSGPPDWLPGMFNPGSPQSGQPRKDFIESLGYKWEEYCRDITADTYDMIFWRRLLGPIFDLCELVGYRVNRERGCDCDIGRERRCEKHKEPTVEYSPKLITKGETYYQIVDMLKRYGVSLPTDFDYESADDYHQLYDQIIQLVEGHRTIADNAIYPSGSALDDTIVTILNTIPHEPDLIGYDRSDHLQLVWYILRSRVMWTKRMNPKSYPRYRAMIRENCEAAITYDGKGPGCVYNPNAMCTDPRYERGRLNNIVPSGLRQQIWREEVEKCIAKCDSMGIPYIIVPYNNGNDPLPATLDNAWSIKFMPPAPVRSISADESIPADESVPEGVPTYDTNDQGKPCCTHCKLPLAEFPLVLPVILKGFTLQYKSLKSYPRFVVWDDPRLQEHLVDLGPEHACAFIGSQGAPAYLIKLMVDEFCPGYNWEKIRDESLVVYKRVTAGPGGTPKPSIPAKSAARTIPADITPIVFEVITETTKTRWDVEVKRDGAANSSTRIRLIEHESYTVLSIEDTSDDCVPTVKFGLEEIACDKPDTRMYGLITLDDDDMPVEDEEIKIVTIVQDNDSIEIMIDQSTFTIVSLKLHGGS